MPSANPRGALLFSAVWALSLAAAPAAFAAQAPPPKKVPKKAAAAPAEDKEAKARQQLLAILEPHTEGMLKCKAIRDQWFAMLTDNSITSATELEQKSAKFKSDSVACTNDIKTAVLARFAETGASDEQQQAAWSEWVAGVTQRHKQGSAPPPEAAKK